MKTQQPAESRKSEDKGFYIILVLCLAAIAVSAYILFWTPDAPASAPDETPITQVMQEEPDAAPTLPSDAPAVENSTAATEPVAVEPADAADSTETFGLSSQANEDALVLPLKSTGIIKAFSEDTLQYDVTMGDWRIHKAADYAAAVGDRVYAVGAGTVRETATDVMYGNCVTLTLENGLSCRYTGLSDKVKVKKGDRVKAGTLIGAVGNSNQMESAMDSHLHLEMFRDGQAIDPAEVLPQGEE